MKQLGTRVNLIPVIAKADTITRADLTAFKNRVSKNIKKKQILFFNILTIYLIYILYQILDCIKFHNINVFCPPIQSDDEDTTRRNTAIAVNK